QRGGWLVHDDQSRVARDRTEDFNLLPLGRPQLTHHRARAKAEPGALIQLDEATVLLTAAEDADDARLQSEQHVLLHRTRRYERNLLRDRGYPGGERITGRVERHWLAVHEQVARVGLVH